MLDAYSRRRETGIGVSTGSCAAAAAKAAALWLTAGACPERVEIDTPAGRVLSLDIVPHSPGCCGVVKDAGGTGKYADATDGMTIFARVELGGGDGPIEFRAGEGIGIVTLPGLKVPVGEPAINPTPRLMIEKSLREIIKNRAAVVTISAPGGEEAAKRTFNPRLGVMGGISILGTRGTVRPMDEQAILESLALELNTHAEEKKKIISLTFGSTGENAARKAFRITGRCVVQAGNFIGFVLDEAKRLGFEQIFICGHPGKLLKVAAGGFNTHNRVADGRMEALCAHAALLGMEHGFIESLYRCATTESAMELLKQSEKAGALWNSLAEAVVRRCVEYSREVLSVAAAFVDNNGAVLGKSSLVDFMAEELRKQ
ncbi:MAG: cobalt-precorrin-5B (C(1))-methyltransferase CbiD [Synergistaceae bacterium]|nr:cobalt-precorrin-5B (C(1))-methyltransferase CbiD [Synergistaceae bacterium]